MPLCGLHTFRAHASGRPGFARSPEQRSDRAGGPLPDGTCIARGLSVAMEAWRALRGKTASKGRPARGPRVGTSQAAPCRGARISSAADLLFVCLPRRAEPAEPVTWLNLVPFFLRLALVVCFHSIQKLLRSILHCTRLLPQSVSQADQNSAHVKRAGLVRESNACATYWRAQKMKITDRPTQHAAYRKQWF
jgi:hypothetical protein